MIKLRKMGWDYWFSYGKNNEIDFSASTLTQVLGANGSGKSSIPLILEEILFGKNSKGIKKQDITNRYVDTKVRDAYLTFSVNEDEYKIDIHRTATTTKMSLYKNGVDISSHTSTGTYKQLADIIGMDFKTFNQLIYQSSKASLEFLTATDTLRKNFLIALLGLDRYAEIYEIFKSEYRNISKIVSELEGSCKTINLWIDKHVNQDLIIKEELPENELESDETQRKEIARLEHELSNIHSINKKRQENNQYKKLLKNIDMNALSEIIEKPESIQNIISERDLLNKEIRDITAKGKKLASLKEAQCPTCLQEINHNIQGKLLAEWRNEVKQKSLKVSSLDEDIAEYREIDKKWKQHKDATEEFERLNMLIDKDLSDEIIDEVELRIKVKSLREEVTEINNKIKSIEKHNRTVKEHNSKVNLVLSQIDEYRKQLTVETSNLEDTNELLTILDILRQSFSTNGLVSYKIEYLVKDLEMEINNYLNEFSAGRFQLAFTLKGEKLNIEIIDNSNSISITALSSGELARVNISTLLAIRKLMSTISSARINLLFLDEIMGVLDNYGKDKLIEVLLEEQGLNTFLVSHEYTHPLLDKITVVKEGNISRVEHG